MDTRVKANARITVIDDELRMLTREKDETRSLETEAELDEKIGQLLLERSLWEVVLREAWP